MERADALRILEQHKAILTGTHVVYTSGRHGSAYVNKDAVYPHTAAIASLCGAMADAFAGAGVEVVVGPTVGGVILAQWVAHRLSARGPEVLAVYAEKAAAGGFELKRGHDALVRGRKVLVVEDVLTTGGSLAHVIETVRAAGGDVVGAAALCNRGGITAAQVGTPPVLFSLVEVSLDSWDEDECPMCRDGVPVNVSVGKGAEFVRRRGEAGR
jgi:orotate phosphoribosyltransferase